MARERRDREERTGDNPTVVAGVQGVTAIDAIMLAAGVGARLSGGDEQFTPKALLRFDGKSLLQRHIETLQRFDVTTMALVVGYHAAAIAAEVAAIGANDFVCLVDNPDYRFGSLVSLWAARDSLTSGEDVLFMDADVLYHPDLVARLVHSRHANCLLMDRDFEAGDEPVKLCLKNGVPVEFRKIVDVEHDTVGEWPGFLRLSAPAAGRVVEALQGFIDAGRRDLPYEEAFRQAMLHGPDTFGVEDITGVPWIEIDFPADLERARSVVLPQLRALATAK
jgi:choline kinase